MDFSARQRIRVPIILEDALLSYETEGLVKARKKGAE
jgi:hypothetical protein